jgi:hypothetical protein
MDQNTLINETSLNQYFKIDAAQGKSITMNESFTDTLACLINICLFTLYKNPALNKNIHLYLRQVNKHFERDKSHIILQAIKVLEYNQYIITPTSIHRDNYIIEKTHVISYYVLKALMFIFLNDFLLYLKKYKFFMNDSNEYINIVLKNIEQFCTILYYYKNFKKINSKSLKMSSLDIAAIKTI